MNGRWFLALIAAVAPFAHLHAETDGPYPSVDADGFVPVAISIRNDADEPIRCVAILAHFITRDLDPVAAGLSGAVVLERNTDLRALAYGSHNGSPMLLENILCGLDSDWTGSRTDVPLNEIRAGSSAGYLLACAGEARLSCIIVPDPASE